MLKQITVRNAEFQQWEALLTNRGKRNQLQRFLVQGVRPITIAVERGWPFEAILYAADRPLSEWAIGILDRVDASPVAMKGELLDELSGKESAELVGVACIPADGFDRLGQGLILVFDRPSNPGNIGTVLRSADAFGAAGVIVTGHAADAYEPQAVRASTGSLFAVPVVRAPSHREVLDWATVPIIGTDEHGTADIAEFDLTRPSIVVIGNETTGMTRAWRDSCDHLLRIPMGGTASSLNAAVAAGIVLYEACRQQPARASAAA